DWFPPPVPRHPVRTVPSPALLRDPSGDLGHAAFQLLLVDDAFLDQEPPQRLDAFLEIAELIVEFRPHLLARAADLVRAYDLGAVGAERIADHDGKLFPRLRLCHVGVDRPAVEAAEIVIAAPGFLGRGQLRIVRLHAYRPSCGSLRRNIRTGCESGA